MRRKNSRTALIVALDVDTFQQARHFVDILYPRVRLFKIGLQLFTVCGGKIIEYIHKKGGGVFLDLKFYDIPNTVAAAARQATRLRVKMFTLHIHGGDEMIRRALQAASNEARKIKVKRPLLIGVTVLTSQKASPGEVLKLAQRGVGQGLDGVVCSAREVGFLKRKIKQRFIAVTPGIRMVASVNDDQKRTATASEALAAGSDFLVVGRPILEASDPKARVDELLR